MKICGRVLTVLAVLLVLFSAVGCSKLRARDQLNKGVQAYKNAKFEDAIEHFKNAVALDPKSYQCPPLFGHCLCPAIYSRRRFT